MLVRKNLRKEKEPSERIRGISAQSSYRAKNSAYTHQKDWGEIHRKQGYSMRKNEPQINTVLEPPNKS